MLALEVSLSGIKMQFSPALMCVALALFPTLMHRSEQQAKNGHTCVMGETIREPLQKLDLSLTVPPPSNSFIIMMSILHVIRQPLQPPSSGSVYCLVPNLHR